MIARRWHGAVVSAKSEAYLKLMLKVALPDYTAIPGNLGAWCFVRHEGAITHFETLTHWEDLNAVKRFAGDDYEIAKYYDFDEEFLFELEDKVLHFDLYALPPE